MESFQVPGLTLPPNYRLVKSGYEYAVLDDTAQLITYFARLSTANRKLTSYLPDGLKTVSQINVWRAPRDPKMDGVVSKMFLYYLDQHGVIVTDSEQTVKGKEMWQRMTEGALDKGDFLYYADFNQPATELVPIKTEEQLYEYFSPVPAKSAWGQNANNSKKLLFISKKSLKTTIKSSVIITAILEVITKK
ncbi:hypothetical protein EAH77_15275 [Ewingella americana]|uniref:Uncharacterized protein n=1 Tax=Ewingella americana TaxID=41202 RepID=A0A502GG05_9GAMM|nr:hypothetical protein EAH77_15275 [Ewingella americana]